MNTMLHELCVAYGQPHKDSTDAAAFMALCARLLASYTETELREGAERLIKGRKYRTWPSVGDCVVACDEARAEIRARMAHEQGRQRQRLRKQQLGPTPEEQAEARDFVDGVADGRIELFPNRPVNDVMDYGLLAKQLRRMAQSMQAKRQSREGSGDDQ